MDTEDIVKMIANDHEMTDNKQFNNYINEVKNEGTPTSFYYLGFCYYFGSIIKKDYQKAYFLFESAANSNHAPSQYQIGRFYENGFGVEIDLKKAMLWYSKAANQNFLPAQIQKQKLYMNPNYGLVA